MQIWEAQEPADEIENTKTPNTNVKGQSDVIKEEKTTRKITANDKADSTDRQDKKVTKKSVHYIHCLG